MTAASAHHQNSARVARPPKSAYFDRFLDGHHRFALGHGIALQSLGSFLSLFGPSLDFTQKLGKVKRQGKLA